MDDPDEVPELRVRPGGYRAVTCRRLERPLPCEEHARCLWCFGDRRAIETARHELFCDWRAEHDPIHFGFPPDLTRHLEG